MRSYSSTLDGMSPEIEQGLRNSIKQLKALKDFADFSFRVLDESVKSKIRSKFVNHRLIEVQQTFEKMVIARTAKERQYALEASVFLFQMAQEFAVASDSQGAEKEGVTGGDDDTSSSETSKP